MLSLYERAVQALPASDIDHHASDLYLKVTPESERILREWIEENGYQNAARGLVTRFRCPLDGCMWLDIPFQYEPYRESISRSHRV